MSGAPPSSFSSNTTPMPPLWAGPTHTVRPFAWTLCCTVPSGPRGLSPVVSTLITLSGPLQWNAHAGSVAIGAPKPAASWLSKPAGNTAAVNVGLLQLAGIVVTEVPAGPAVDVDPGLDVVVEVVTVSSSSPRSAIQLAAPIARRKTKPTPTHVDGEICGRGRRAPVLNTEPTPARRSGPLVAGRGCSGA